MANAYFFGEDGEWFRDEILQWLDLAPESKIWCQHAAFAELRAQYDPDESNTAIAKILASELNTYAGSSRWKEKDKNRESSPYLAGSRQELFFTILKLSVGQNGAPKVPKARTIRGILDGRGKVGQNYRGQMAQKTAHLSVEDQRKDRAPMNAITPHSDQKRLEVLLRTPEVDKIISEEAVRAAADRQKILDEIAAAEAKANRDFPQLEKNIQIALAGVKKAEQQLREANDRLRAENYAVSNARHGHTSYCQRREEILRAGADGKLFGEFRSAMLDEFDAVRRNSLDARTIVARNPVTLKDDSVFYSNIASVKRRLAAINLALEEGERLRLAADQGGIAERLAAIRAGLPKIEPAVIPEVKTN